MKDSILKILKYLTALIKMVSLSISNMFIKVSLRKENLMGKVNLYLEIMNKYMMEIGFKVTLLKALFKNKISFIQDNYTKTYLQESDSLK
jgi:hypothetical protein